MIETNSLRHVHRSIVRYLEKPSEDRRFLLVDAREALEQILGPGDPALRLSPRAEPGRQDFVRAAPLEVVRAKTIPLQDRIVAVLQKYNKPVRRDVLIREVGCAQKSVANSLTALVRAGTVRRKRPSFYELAAKPQAIGHEVIPKVLQGLAPGKFPYRVVEVLLRGGWWNASSIARAIGTDNAPVTLALIRLHDRNLVERTGKGHYRILEDAAA